MLGLLLLLAAGCAADKAPLPQLLETPIPSDTQTPNLAADHERLYVSWVEKLEGRWQLRFATYDGTTWSVPRTIPVDGELFVNWADFASVEPLGGGRLAAHYLQRVGGAGHAYHAYLRLSPDGGQTWEAALRVHQDVTDTDHGFASLVARPDGGLDIVWLDGRETTDPGGRMRLMYRSWTTGALGDERLLDPDVCTCCQTSAARTPAGLLVAYRDHTAGEIRDISTVRATDGGWTEPATVHRDGWSVAGCPVNGPALDAAGGHVAVAWFTAAGGEPQVHVGRSTAGGAFDPPLRVDAGHPLGRVGLVALDDGGVVVSWLESAPRGASTGATPRNAEIRVRRLDPDHDARPSQVVARTAAGPASGFPRIARLGGRLFVAWTEPQGASSRVRLAALDL